MVSPFFVSWPGGCSLFWRSACQAWTQMPCIPSCWTLPRLMATAGSMSMGNGCRLGNQSHQTTAVSTSTQTLPTLGPIGWKLPFPSAKSNLPTSSMGVGRYGLMFPHTPLGFNCKHLPIKKYQGCIYVIIEALTGLFTHRCQLFSGGQI